MPVLAFDTARAHCAGALLSGGAVTARVEPMAKGQAERLVPMLEEMLEAAGLGWRDLSALGVGTGPGNFTGTRIAVALARGLALGLGIPAVGVSAFEALEELRPGRAWRLVPGSLGTTYGLAGGTAAPVEMDAAAVGALEGTAVALDEVPAEEAVAAIAWVAARRAREPGLPRPAPLYVRPADAAPSRDPLPAILPG